MVALDPKGHEEADTIRTANYIVIISVGMLSESSKSLKKTF